MIVRPWAVLLLLAGAASAAAQPAPAAAPQAPLTGLNPAQLFALAEQLRGQGRPEDAATLLRALTGDPDAEIRAEARFRLALLLEAQGRRAEAATLLRRLLDEKPDAARVRLELARMLALLGDEAGAARELRQAQAAGLPPDVARVVEQFTTALRSRAPLGASLEVALAPDTNINRATAAPTLDTVIAPIDLDADARQRSGVGLALSGQAFARLPLGQGLRLLPRLSAGGRLYREARFNDVVADARIGIERAGTLGGRLTLSGGWERRWFGGRRYSEGALVSLDWLRPTGATAQATLGASVQRLRVAPNPLQDGTLYQLSGGYEFALSARAGASVSVAAARQTAADAGYAFWSAGPAALAYAEAGRTTLFASVAVRRLEGDGALFLFPAPRREWFMRASLGATLRQATIRGFAPVVRLTHERNASNVGLYDYRRTAAEIGISRAF